MNPQRIYDAVQLVGLGLVTAGAWATWGAGIAAMAAGGVLLVLPIVEIRLLGGRGA